MRFILSILLINLCLVSCIQAEKESFILKGNIEGDFKSFIYLKYENKIDSVQVTDNKFIFKGSVNHPTEAVLLPISPSLNVSSGVATFMLENSIIKIATKYSSIKYRGTELALLELDTLSGSTSQELYYDFQKQLVNSYKKETNDSIREIILFKTLNEFITNHPESELAGKFTASNAGLSGYLSPSQLEILLEKMDTTFQTKHDIDKITQLILNRRILRVGTVSPKVILPDQNGNLINSSTLNKKLVLLEFWASWCGPCRKANPKLTEIYSEFDSKGFEIMGISLDKNFNNWKDAIKEDHLNWIQTIDTTGTYLDKFYATEIPFNVLLDSNGKILAKKLNPDELRKILNAEI